MKNCGCRTKKKKKTKKKLAIKHKNTNNIPRTFYRIQEVWTQSNIILTKKKKLFAQNAKILCTIKQFVVTNCSKEHSRKRNFKTNRYFKGIGF